ncbi:MAG: TonB-dependent receptor, partial [Muribaculaceae bacterium]|nr:TonB-dependent receptor [Muribaculaceae bacterium]
MNTLHKIRILILSLLSVIAFVASSQTVTQVSGVVYEDDGTTPLTGATVMQQGMPASAVMTDVDGKYKVTLKGTKPAIQVSFIGFDTKTIKVDGRTHIDVTMQTSAVQLNDVVVTALGITREQKSLGYAVTTIDNKELTNTVSGNWLNSINGKVAGLTMDQAGSGPMSSMRVVLRGDQSLNYGANEALFVVDGVPISSGGTSTSNGTNYYTQHAPVEFGNDAADIHPEEV